MTLRELLAQANVDPEALLDADATMVRNNVRIGFRLGRDKPNDYAYHIEIECNRLVEGHSLSPQGNRDL